MKVLLLCSIMVSGLVYIIKPVKKNEVIKGQQQSNFTDTGKGLNDYYKSYFPIGVAVSLASINDKQSADLIIKQFGSVTSENAMKMGPIHPSENYFNWAAADSIVAFAQAHHLKIRGHNLCWHQQTPKWFFKDSAGNLVTKQVLLQRLKTHITTVVNRYKGKIYAWDVVNEAIDDNPVNFLRNSLFYKICGEDFITKAFEYAHAADPNAILFYNDYNTERKEKADRIYTLLKKLKDNGVPINAIGLQGHWSIFEPSQTELEYTMNKFISLGLKIQITELDVSIYKWEKEERKKLSTDDDRYTPALEAAQTAKYKMLFSVFRKYQKDITGVTFWNVSDKYTWLDTYPIVGRKNYPLLFDAAYQPKKAFWEVVNF